jgi:alkane 1-monooxygenase
VLVAGAAAVGGLTGLGLGERIAAVFGFAIWLGQVGAANGHELIHRGNRWLFGLGRMVFVSLLFGHHVSAHRLVHHSHVATDRDPNSALRGEGVYRFLLRSWVGSFRVGFAAERARAAAAGRRGTPYRLYLGGAAAVIGAVGLGGAALAGAEGAVRAVGGLLVLCLYAQGQILVSDYVQHYGLRRRTGPDGRTEPVGSAHSWNAPHPVSSALMLHAARHSDHHAHPARPWPALRLPPRRDAPQLPASLPVMGIVALIPPLFRRMMHPRLPR